MTDFSEGSRAKCEVCGGNYHTAEGKLCDCWKCSSCGESFADFDMLGDRERWMCLYCVDAEERERKEEGND